MMLFSGKFKHRVVGKNSEKSGRGLDLQINKCYKYCFIQLRGLPGGSSGRSEQWQT